MVKGRRKRVLFGDGLEYKRSLRFESTLPILSSPLTHSLTHSLTYSLANYFQPLARLCIRSHEYLFITLRERYFLPAPSAPAPPPILLARYLFALSH